ncbi:hypothetical protein GGQ74_000905 [Desulfobaculum xiamenense]|uniref:TadE-like domain-containing protein n=1 Tax=Desulfobaculum xiamenense TaxID=995050 RepID=A0A846QPC3_9BACT|nr:TadE/TadG family type IV pilus assembly protein [Desulfobaculum xiamenense]NJB67265.1 hypothetical protein [Desulfobaculum xiamenense]
MRYAHAPQATTSRHGGRRGISAVEFALILPVVLGLVMVVVELGNVYFTQATLTKAATGGARLAVTGQGDMEGDRLDRIRARVRELSDVLDLPQPEGAIEIMIRSWDNAYGSGTPEEGDPGRPCEMVEVEVRCPYRPLTPLIGGALTGDLVLSGHRRMVNEPWQPCEFKTASAQ